MAAPDLTQVMRGFQESRVLLTAIELNVFAAVGQGATAAQVAQTIETDARATETLLNALVAVQALAKKDGVYQNTAASEPLREARAALMHTANMWNAWHTLTDCVRAGTAVIPPGIDKRDQRWTESFIAAMHRNAQVNAAQLVRAVDAAEVRRMLDIGGGSAAYSIEFAKANPGLRAEVLDVATVLPIAQSHIDQARLGDRITTRAGDLRSDEFGENYDLILLSAICHMLGPGENRDLFRRCGRALAPGGRLVVRDFILEPDKTAPKMAALFAINMLVATKSGSTYTEREYRQWLEEAGFRRIDRPDPDLLVAE